MLVAIRILRIAFAGEIAPIRGKGCQRQAQDGPVYALRGRLCLAEVRLVHAEKLASTVVAWRVEGRERQLVPFVMALATAATGIRIAVVRPWVPGLDNDGAVLHVIGQVHFLEGRGNCCDPSMAGVGVDGTRELCVRIAAFTFSDCSAQTASRSLVPLARVDLLLKLLGGAAVTLVLVRNPFLRAVAAASLAEPNKGGWPGTSLRFGSLYNAQT